MQEPLIPQFTYGYRRAQSAAVVQEPHCPGPLTAFKSTSQPFLASPSQSAKPAMHENVHLPRLQLASAAFWGTGQTRRQRPQFWASNQISCSQPLLKTPSQFASPVELPQLNPQTPLTQLASPTTPPPRPPRPPSPSRGGSGQTLLQRPQFRRSVFTSVSHPFVITMSQSCHPRLHLKPHFPCLHVRSVWGGARGHLCLNFPQLSTSFHSLASAQGFVHWGQDMKLKYTISSHASSEGFVTHRCEGCRRRGVRL